MKMYVGAKAALLCIRYENTFFKAMIRGMKLFKHPLELGNGKNLNYKAAGILQYLYQIMENP